MLTHLLPMLQETSGTSFEYSTQGSLGTGGFLVMLAIGVLMIIAMWKVFTKAGEPGWAALIPIYNAIVYLRIAGKPFWWIFLFLIPFVNFVIALLVCLSLAKSFGKGAGFGIGLLLLSPIFILILAFDSSKYLGPKA